MAMKPSYTTSWDTISKIALLRINKCKQSQDHQLARKEV